MIINHYAFCITNYWSYVKYNNEVTKQWSVIFPGMNYNEALKTSELPIRSIHRDLPCKVSKAEHKLNYFLEKRNEHPYCLSHNQMY